jgi:thiamine transporter
MASSLVPVPRHSLAVRVRARLNADPRGWGVGAIAEMGVAVALAALLGPLVVGALVPLRMPQGGSVTLEMLPILFVAVRRGAGPGVVVGAVYGALQLILPGAFIYHPVQVLLDYPLAFAAVGLAGLVPVRTDGAPREAGEGWLGGAFRGIWALVPAVVVGSGARFVFHFLSGLVFFASYAPAWEAPWLYSLTYNLLYLVPEAIVTTIVLWPLLKAYDAAFGTGDAAGGGGGGGGGRGGGGPPPPPAAASSPPSSSTATTRRVPRSSTGSPSRAPACASPRMAATPT